LWSPRRALLVSGGLANLHPLLRWRWVVGAFIRRCWLACTAAANGAKLQAPAATGPTRSPD